jgi:hypothetical protein
MLLPAETRSSLTLMLLLQRDWKISFQSLAVSTIKCCKIIRLKHVAKFFFSIQIRESLEDKAYFGLSTSDNMRNTRSTLFEHGRSRNKHRSHSEKQLFDAFTTTVLRSKLLRTWLLFWSMFAAIVERFEKKSSCLHCQSSQPKQKSNKPCIDFSVHWSYLQKMKRALL